MRVAQVDAACSLACAKQSSLVFVVMSLFRMNPPTFSSFCSSPSSTMFPSWPVSSPSPMNFAAAPLAGEFGRMASSTPCTGYEPKYGFNYEMDTASLYKQEDTFQERASLGASEQCARGRSESRSTKSLAGTIPTVLGSSMGGSFGRPEHDRISETSLFSHSRRPKKLASSSASTIDDLMLKEKRKGTEMKTSIKS